MSPTLPPSSDKTLWDHSSDQNFVDYYEKESQSAETIQRFTLIRDKAIDLLAKQNVQTDRLEVADIGCGAGTQARLWASLGHTLHGLDVNAELIRIAQERTLSEGLIIDFRVGSATKLPFPDQSMDIVLIPELLEHVAAWEECLNEACRIVKPRGLLYLSTTSSLCPKQQEFNLPLYSWYPSALKHHYERLAVTTRPELANYCKYPAVNWFSPYALAHAIQKRGFRTFDRFDLMDTTGRSLPVRLISFLLKNVPPIRFAGHLATPGTILFALRN